VLNININLWWGLVLLAFGALMLVFAWRRRKTPPQQK
jgi:HAMP domain-containing protein